MNVVGLKCQIDYPPPSVSILRQMVQYVQCVLSQSSVSSASVWSSSFVPPPHNRLHHSKYHCLEFPVVAHSGDVPKQTHFLPHCFLQDRLFPVHSTECCVICYFLCPFKSHD